MIDAVVVPEGRSGDWAVSKFEVQAQSIENMRLAFSGRGCAPGEYTKLTCRGRGVVMSDTTAERRDHYPFVSAARGRCLINGLGLGMCLAAALQKPEVSFVTVIEAEEDVIRLVWPSYCGERCEVIHADAFEYKPPKDARYGAVWHDVWDTICQDNYEEMKRLHRKYGRKADWQGSWGRPEIERMNREDKRSAWRW